jgi:hypothetical protein
MGSMMRIVGCLAVGAYACSFEHGGGPSLPRDAATQIDIATPGDSVMSSDAAVCGNGVVEPGEDCEIGMTSSCTTSCGDTGTQACNADCTHDTCNVVIAPGSAWDISTNGTSYSSTTLPDVDWPCDNCTRYFRTSICDQPTAVEFRWSSDNAARMTVNGAVAFDTYWIANYCSDAPCCNKCCDTNANCLARLSAPQSLGATALGLFDAGANELRWEVHEEVGGSGFYTVMTVRY